MARLECKKCGHEYMEFGKWTKKFCKKCGNKLPEFKMPPKCSCGKFIFKGDKFCQNCGKEVEKKKKTTNKTKNGR